MGRTRRQAQCRPRNRLRQVLSDGNAPVSSARRLHCASVSAATSQAGGATSAGGRARTIRRPPAPWSSSRDARRSEEHTSELQSLMRHSYAVFCLKKKKEQDTENE